MAKRKTFYVRADLFEARISLRAKLVLVYLSRVSDRQGVSFPSVPTIARMCGCCPNTARKAIRELAGAGFISVAAATLPTRSGKTRWATNRYTLLFVPSRNEVPLLHPVQGGTSTGEGLSYNRELTMDVPYGHSQSVGDRTDPDRDREHKKRVSPLGYDPDGEAAAVGGYGLREGKAPGEGHGDLLPVAMS